ncbi:MAG: ATP-binding protein, partial [Acidimicrobiales bacterium]
TRDADAAREIARRLGAACELRRVEVAPGPGLEERARSARYGVVPPDVCVGHTADDRAETVLLNLGRGSGLSGVAAPMARVLRPLLRLRRSETVALCRRLDLPVVDDPMNRSVEHARVAIRTRVLPALAEALDRDPVPILVRHADLAAEAMAVIGELAETVDVTDVRKLCSVPRAVAAEAVRRWLARELDLGTAVDRGSIDRVLAVAAGEAIATEIVGGHRVARSRGRLSVGPAETRPPGLG